MDLKNLRIAWILPAFNEEVSIRRTIESVVLAMPDAEIVVIDNASTDRTQEICLQTFKDLKCKGRLVCEPIKGKANALRTAFYETQAEYFITMDADFTYDASNAQQMLELMISNNLDMVVGNRHHDHQYSKLNKRLFHTFGNKFVVEMINLLFGSNLKDILSGYRVIHRRFIELYPILSSNFEVEVEMTLHALHNRFRIKELPVNYRNRPEGSFSKLNTYGDGIKVIQTILWIFKDYRPLTFFSLVSFLVLILGLSSGYFVSVEYFSTGFVTRVPLAILSSGMVIVSMLLFTIGIILHSISKYHKIIFELKKNQVYRRDLL